MEMKTDPSCEAADDVFYAELRRQILLLTFEDGDENAVFPKTRRLDARGGAKHGSADDVFYAELRRQILLLTFEDGDENAVFPKTRRLDARGGAKHGSGSSVPAVRLLPRSCFGWSEIENSNAVPTWLVNLWRHGNETGVFIPHIAKSRRRPKSERRNNARGTIYKPVANGNE